MRWSLVVLALAACSRGETSQPPVTPGPKTVCDRLGLQSVAFTPGGEGARRRDLAADFALPIVGGELVLSDLWTGCDVVMVVGDGWTTPEGEALWAVDDLNKVLKQSAPNVQWIFVTQRSGATAVADAVALIQAKVDAAIDKLDAGDEPGQQSWWRDRVHVIQKGTGALGRVGKLVEELGGGASFGFAIDRFQRIHGIGSLADNHRYDSSLAGWPFRDNLTMLVNEVDYLNFDAAREHRVIGLRNPTEVVLWQGDVLAEYADITVDLPSSDQIASFDSLLLDIGAYCPDPDADEFNSCGPWDYIGNFFLEGDTPGTWVELGRFITPYHREARYLLDLSYMLPLLEGGGPRTFRYSFAPSWNTQPTESWLTLRFSNEGKGSRAMRATPLFSGGALGPDYDAAHPPIEVSIAPTTTRVELSATTTGHGATADKSCAEFCDHSHVFTVGGVEHTVAFPDVADDQGCMVRAGEGVTPNQWGTWWFGRGGWCPGMQVDPFTADITAEIGAGGAVGYRALVDGSTPTSPQGDVVLTSWVIEYE